MGTKIFYFDMATKEIMKSLYTVLFYLKVYISTVVSGTNTS